MSITTYGWLVLIFPLAGAILIGLTFKALPQRVHGVIGILAIFLAFLSAVGMLIKLGDRSRGAASRSSRSRGTTRTRSASTRSCRS